MAARYAITELSKRYHQAIVDWQRANFKDYQFLIDNWHKYYQQEPFRLVAKVGEVPGQIEIGSRAGKPKFEKAHQMKGNMFFTCAAIVKAQASTEFGSIQQHRQTVDQAIDDETRFDSYDEMIRDVMAFYSGTDAW